MNTKSVLFTALFVTLSTTTIACANDEVSSSSEGTSELTATSGERGIFEQHDAIDVGVSDVTRAHEIEGHWTFLDASIPGWSNDRIDVVIAGENADLVVVLASYEHPLHVTGRRNVHFGTRGMVHITGIADGTAVAIDLKLTPSGLSYCKSKSTDCVTLSKETF